MNRRILCFILALVMCLTLIACGKKQNDSAAKEENATASADIPAAATDADGNPVEAPKNEQEKADSPATEPIEEVETKPAFQPGVDTTLPPEVDASLGVEKDDTPAIDDDTIDTQSPEATKPSTQPNEDPSQIGDDFDLKALDYEGYHALSGADQQRVISMFGSPDDFMVWYSAIEAQYKAAHPDIEIGSDGVVDAGGIGG